MRKLNKAILSAIVIGGLAVTPVSVYAKNNDTGNGNDGCWIDDIEGHKKGQSNEHKITTMTKAEWLSYLEAKGIAYKQMSNNDGSNGWITFHLYGEDGQQIEVVHIRYKVEEPEVPDVEEPEKPDVEEPEVPDVEEPETPDVEEPEVPDVEEPEKPDVEEPEKPDVEEPEAPDVEEPEAPDVEEPEVPEEEENIPWTPIEPADKVDTENPEEKQETSDDKEQNKDNNVNINQESKNKSGETNIDNPQTGDVGVMTSVITGLGSIAALIGINRKRK